MKEIVQRDEPILRAIAAPVPVKDIGSDKIKKVLKDMKEAMAKQKDGVAIAAPQIGVSLRIFMVSGDLLGKADHAYESGPDLVFINPEIVRLSRDKKEVEEGCLSVRWLYGMIKRSTKATLKAYDENGKRIERGASGLLAQIFQHEVDHLNGILFIDKADNVWEMTDEEIADLKK